jgi:hypothetical protein
LLAGVARVDVTPPAGIQLFGYHRDSPMDGVLDQLSATALVLASEPPCAPLVIVAVDHVGRSVAATREVRALSAQAAGTSPDRVAICYSHTHSGPDDETLDWQGQERPAGSIERVYGAALPYQIASAVTLARQRLAPARVAAAEAECALGVNRREHGPDGRARMGINPHGSVDRRAAVLRIDTAGGRPLASLLHYGVHGVALRADNLACSADVAGAARRVVEAATGAPCLVVQGAAGDVNPRWRGDVTALRRCGWELGGAALRALAEAEPGEDAAGPPLAAAAETVPIALLPLPDEAAAARLAATVERAWDAPTGAWRRLVRERLARGEQTAALPIEVQALRAGPFIRVGLPMEPFGGLSLAFRAKLAATSAPDRAAGVAALGGYTNGLFGYLPTAEEHAAGGYEIEWMPVVYGFYSGLLMPPVAGAGEQLVDCAVRLASRLRDEAAT